VVVGHEVETLAAVVFAGAPAEVFVGASIGIGTISKGPYTSGVMIIGLWKLGWHRFGAVGTGMDGWMRCGYNPSRPRFFG
jgi:hypothetical protein